MKRLQTLLPLPNLPARRRDLLRAAAASAAGIAFPALAQGKVLKLGSTFDNSGVEKANGSSLFKGATAHFNAVNKAGGINGSKVELVLADDQFKPDVAKANALAFAADASILGLLTPLGTRQTAAVMGAVTNLAIIGPNTGTAELRKASPPNLFWIRASYDQEVEKLIRTASTVGITRIAMVHPNDPLGKSVLAAFQKTMAALKLEPVAIATTPGTTSTEVDPAALALAKAAPQLVIMALAGVVPLFVKAFRQAGGSSTLYGLSIGASAANIAALGEQGRGVGFSIVVPSPFAPKHAIVRHYQEDMAASGWSDYSLPSLEGYINARVAAEGLRRAGAGVSRDSLIAALDRIEALDLGGLRIGFGKGNRIGGNFVDVAVIGQDGRMLS